MISIIHTDTRNYRTFGWVQDPSNLRSLCDVVAVFDYNSEKHNQLINQDIPRLVNACDGRDDLIAALSQRPLRIKYAQLVGTSFTPRSASRCNGIIQAAVKGQKRDFIGDWPADNYVRWAHCFGFIAYDYSDDSFEITENGRRLSMAKGSGDELTDLEKSILTDAVLAYPPAVRILSLLTQTDRAHLTKFEIGQNLGFIGEDGFTSMPQNIFIRSLATASPSEKSAMRSDWEGSSDKYARMIAGWLEKLGLVARVPKTIMVCAGGESFTETIGQAYMITACGVTALRRAEGRSKHKRIAKNVCWEMLSTKGEDRVYLRTRRALVLKCIAEGRKEVSVHDIVEYMKTFGFDERENTILDDINGLRNIGICIKLVGENTFLFDDKINDFSIPLSNTPAKSDLAETKETLRERMQLLSHEYLALVDIAYDSKQNRLFEMKTLELLIEECGYQGLHLGGSRKPDGIIFTEESEHKYGVIIDTKAYSNGYSLPISQADEMERYIEENQKRDKELNANKWWLNYSDNISEFFFMFVSGHFKGGFDARIERIRKNKGIDGTAIAISNLLLLVEAYKEGVYSHELIYNEVFRTSEFTI